MRSGLIYHSGSTTGLLHYRLMIDRNELFLRMQRRWQCVVMAIRERMQRTVTDQIAGRWPTMWSVSVLAKSCRVCFFALYTCCAKLLLLSANLLTNEQLLPDTFLVLIYLLAWKYFAQWYKTVLGWLQVNAPSSVTEQGFVLFWTLARTCTENPSNPLRHRSWRPKRLMMRNLFCSRLDIWLE